MVFICLAVGCKEHNGSELQVKIIPKKEVSPITLSEFALWSQLIILETSKQNLLGNIKDVKVLKNNIFVTEVYRVSIFDFNGRFIQTLGKRGEGPGEYKSVSSMDIDEATGKIYLSAWNKLMVYDSTFHLIEERKLDYPLNYLKIVDGDLWVVSEEIAVEIGEGEIANLTNIYKLDKEYRITDTIPFRSIMMDQKRIGGYPFRHWISDIDEGRFMFMPVLTPENLLRDTLYRIEGNTVKPAVRFQFERPQSLDENGYQTLLLYNIVNSKSYYLLEYDQDWKRFMFLYDKKAQKGYNLSEGLIDEAGDAVFLRPLDLNQDLFYYIKKVEFEDKSIEEQNPLIGIVKLK